MHRVSKRNLSRRQFVAATSSAVALAALGPHVLADSTSPSSDLQFFVIGDTHYLADKHNPARLDERSKAVTSRLIDTLNALPGSPIPDEAGGGIVGAPRGVIHAGDLIDSGDKNGESYAAMHHTEFNAYVKDFGLNGNDGRLKTPIYEIHGNHDGPAGAGVPIDGIIARNKTRPNLKTVSANGLHYSWDWERIHFINLGIVVGQVKSVTRRRRYNPLASLDFLLDDLRQNVRDSGRPVILTHHVDMNRNLDPRDPSAAYSGKEWDPCDVEAFYNALKPYNVIAIFFGHTHVRNIFKWNGLSVKAGEGIDVFNVAKASHYASETQAMFHVQISNSRLMVREYRTHDRWLSGAWTPQVWSKPINLGKT